MIPESLKLEQSDHTLYWTTINASINSFDAKEVSSHIKQIITDQHIETVVVDNRAVTGAWSPEVDTIWIDLMRFMPIHVKRTAALCNDVIGKIQLNYLSSQAGSIDTIKADRKSVV